MNSTGPAKKLTLMQHIVNWGRICNINLMIEYVHNYYEIF